MSEPKSLIVAGQKANPALSDPVNYLPVSELFINTLQGEGFYAGFPASFLRLSGCHLNCNFCDSKALWATSERYSFAELFTLLEDNNTIKRLKEGQHLVITGGAPLLHQKRITLFLKTFEDRYYFNPFIELENECTLKPSGELVERIGCFNNSPKLKNSGVDDKLRYKPEVLSYQQQYVGKDKNWFKFVVSNEDDMKEILSDFVQPGYVRKEQIILMPQGASRQELEKSRTTVAELAMSYNVRYADRLQILLYDQRTGV